MRAVTGDLEGAMRDGRAAERIARAIGDDSALALALQNLAFAYLTAGQAREAIDTAAGAVEAHRAAGNQWGVAGALHHLAYAHYLAGDGRQSRALAEQAAQMCQAVGNQRFRSAISVLLALLAWQDGEEAATATLARDTISSADPAVDQWNIARAMQLLGWSAAAAGRADRVAILFGGSQSLLDSTHDHSDLAELPPQREAEAVARQALGEDAYARCFASGYSMPAPDAVRYALNR
jgi:tetratricopeptide (TPR) repeat protein